MNTTSYFFIQSPSSWKVVELAEAEKTETERQEQEAPATENATQGTAPPTRTQGEDGDLDEIPPTTIPAQALDTPAEAAADK